jgi:protein-tyrosine-phosphatase
VAATRGKQLFDGIHLTAEYFFDAIGARYEGGLTYRGIEHKGDMEKHSSVREDVREAAGRLTAPFRDRRVVLFAGRNNTGASRMAGAFTRYLAGDRWEAVDAGVHPADAPDKTVQKVMHERGIDMGFRNPVSLEYALERALPDRVIDLGAGGSIPDVPGAKVQRWDLPAAAGLSEDRLTALRDEIEKRVREELASNDENA